MQTVMKREVPGGRRVTFGFMHLLLPAAIGIALLVPLIIALPVFIPGISQFVPFDFGDLNAV